MHYFRIILLTVLMPYAFLHAEQLEVKLQECLIECWGVDPHTTRFLCQYFKPFLENKNSHHHITEFLNQSHKLNIQFPTDKKLICLPSHDGVIQATKFHPVVYETPYVRIMAGAAAPDEREPFHTHIWKSLLVVFEEASYYVEYANGSSEFLNLRSPPATSASGAPNPTPRPPRTSAAARPTAP